MQAQGGGVVDHGAVAGVCCDVTGMQAWRVARSEVVCGCCRWRPMCVVGVATTPCVFLLLVGAEVWQ